MLRVYTAQVAGRVWPRQGDIRLSVSRYLRMPFGVRV